MKRFNPNSIRIIRTIKNMTLDEFAKSIGNNVSRQIVFQWEKGKQVPSIPSLLRIVNSHKVPFEIFFEQDEFSGKIQQEAD